MLFFNMPEDIIVITSFFLSIFFPKYSIKFLNILISIKIYSIQKWWRMIYFIFLSQMTDSDEYFGWLFRMTVSDDFSRWLFQMTISDDYSRCLFQMTFSDDCSGWLFLIQRLIQILATNLYFHGRFLFQPIIRLIGPTTDSFLNDGFLLQNYGPDPPDRNFTLEAPPGDCLCKDLPRYCKRNASQMFLENFKTLSVYLWTTLLCRLNFNKFFYIQTSPLQKYCGFEKPRKVKATFYLFFHRKTTNTKYLLHIFFKKFWKLLFFSVSNMFLSEYI